MNPVKPPAAIPEHPSALGPVRIAGIKMTSGFATSIGPKKPKASNGMYFNTHSPVTQPLHPLTPQNSIYKMNGTHTAGPHNSDQIASYANDRQAKSQDV